MKKRGSHVGVILSFVIFVTFLLFIYTIIQPRLKFQREKEEFLEYLKIKLSEKFLGGLMSISVITYKAIPQNCIELRDFITEIKINSRIIVKKETDIILDTRVLEGIHLQINRTSIDDYFFKIYNSEEFVGAETNPITPCGQLQLGDYSIELIKNDSRIFKSKILKLINEYETNYDGLKEQLNIPLGTEFSFSFETTEGEILKPTTEEIPETTNVFVEETPILYIDEDGNLESGFLTIKVW